MTFQIKPHAKNSFWNKNIFRSVFLILIVLFLVGIWKTDYLKSYAVDGLSPFLKMGDYFYNNIRSVSKNFSSNEKLLEENNILLELILKYESELTDREAIVYENQKLREDLRLKPESTIYAPIIGRPPQVALDTLFLDSGSSQGVKVGDWVLSGERVLIGKIEKVTKNKSVASLNSFAGHISFGFVARTQEPLEIEGVSGGLKASLPINFDIAVGDKIMVSGRAKFLAAIVKEIEEDHSLGFKEVFLSLPVDISKIDSVFIESNLDE